MRSQTLSWDARQGWSAELPSWDSDNTLVLAFGDASVEADRTPLAALRNVYRRAVLVGCSTSGQIVGSSVRDNALSVSVTAFDDTCVRSVSVDVTAAAGSHAAGLSLGERLHGPALRAVFVLSDGLRVNGSALVAGLVATVGPDVIVTGGLAGDDGQFARTWVIDAGEICTGRVVAIGLYGARVHVTGASVGGWGIFGPERVITRSAENVLYELDGKPALGLYRRYLGDLADGLPGSALLFPLAVRQGGDESQLVRTVLGVDEAEQSMTFAGDVPVGWRAQLMRSSPDQLIDTAAAAALHPAPTQMTQGQVLAVAVSCIGRRLVLGGRTDEEIEAVLDGHPDLDLVGFYSFGEIGPDALGRCDLHNQTLTLTTVWEG